MEVGEGNAGWERLLEAQSEYIANLQRMLHTACQNAAPNSGQEGAAGEPVSRDAPQDTSHKTHSMASAPGSVAASSGTPQSHGTETMQRVSHLRPQQPLPADEGAGSCALERLAAAAEACGEPSQSDRMRGTGSIGAGGAAACGAIAGATSGAGGTSSAIGPVGGYPGVGLTGSVSSLASAATANTQQATVIPTPASDGAGRSDPVVPSIGNMGSVGLVIPAYQDGAAARYEETANEVLRLRLQKSQHEELRGQLSRAENQLRRLSPHAVFQLRSYLERQFREQHTAAQVQEPLVRLLECLCTVCRIEVGALTHINLLNAIRKLFRDPHSFTAKLSHLPQMTSEEAKGLAPFLLHSAQYRRAREKDPSRCPLAVNECYEAFHAWLSAFYLFSVVSDQVLPTTQALERQEWLLRQLSTQAEKSEFPSTSGVPSPSNVSIPPVPVTQAPVPVPPSPSSVSATSGHVLTTPVRMATAGRLARGSAGTNRANAVASPIGRLRSAADSARALGSPVPPRSSPVHVRNRPAAEQASVPTSGIEQSRSPSPGSIRAMGTGILRQRPHAGGGTAAAGHAGFGSTASARPGLAVRGGHSSVASVSSGSWTQRRDSHVQMAHVTESGSSIRGGHASTLSGSGAVQRRDSHVQMAQGVDGNSNTASGISSTGVSSAGVAAAAAAAQAAGIRNKSPLDSPGLTRVQSEKVIVPARSPRAGRKESRSPSPGTGRASPAAPPPRAMRPLERISNATRDDAGVGQARGMQRRILSPSQSEGSLNSTQRMVSAPTGYQGSLRSVQVRTQAPGPPLPGGRSGSGPGSGAGGGSSSRLSAVTSGRGAGNRPLARPMSPDKGGGAPRHEGGLVDATPRSADSGRGCGLGSLDSYAGSRDCTRSHVTSFESSGSEDDDDDFGPRRRRLSAKQYEALVRCAEQVVAVSAAGSVAAMPYAPP
eukprot:TRINITY_DN29479_c0_g1_i1.p1 TRINITY_DN29479_c0_g1~~TRINITY_DN29479_c0_g1_i1.p1  ORF type:complete len:959 (-),score=132.49 TRINITY_DN29479_c0_g1_i1:263-3082(-)